MFVVPFRNDNQGKAWLFGYCDRCFKQHNPKGYYYVSVDGTLLCFLCFTDEVENHIFEFGEYTPHKDNPHPEIEKVTKLIT